MSQVNKAGGRGAREVRKRGDRMKVNDDRVGHTELQGHNTDVAQLVRKMGWQLKFSSG